MTKLRWGILGTGLIAGRFAKGVIESSALCEIVAVGSRTQASADKFGDEFGIATRHASYESLLANPDIHAVYISTPHPMHAEWAIKCAEAGKHILVEKPMAMNWPEAMAIVDAARVYDVFLMEAFMYRTTPQTKKIVEIVKSGVLGEVRVIHASFGYHTNAPNDSRFFGQDLGGGGILDVGSYPASMARLIAGAAIGKTFDDPISVKGVGHLGETGTDDWALAVLKFKSGICAEISTSLRVAQDEYVKIYGSKASLHVPLPWVAGLWERDSKLILRKTYANETEEILVHHDKNLYADEADTVAANIAHRQAPEMSWDDSLGNMRVLDRWRAEIGLLYDLEKGPNVTRTITGRPLNIRPGNNMRYGRVAGVDKKISRLVMGCDSNNTMPETAILFDDFFERGGNAFDTSFAYGNPNGATEKNLGQWIKNRGIRDQVVVIEKGANYERGNPKGLSYEIVHGLERLQMDYCDIYMVHRDNVDVPIGEWVDVLNEHLRAGRMKIFGLSNFSIERLDAFNNYAIQKGLKTFSIVSNQFSLAQVLGPLWDMHLVFSSDAASRAWFTRTQTPLFPWSSQARGFFLDAATPENRSNVEWNNSWYSDGNFQRKARAVELAKKRGVETINIALAYVLNQPFPTFPLVGPKQLSEIRSTFKALDIELSPEELKWLSLE